MADLFIWLKSVLALPCVASWQGDGVDTDALVHAVAIKDDGSSLRLSTLAGDEIPIRPPSTADRGGGIVLEDGCSTWQAYAEIQHLLLEQSSELIGRGSAILRALTQADHHGSGVDGMLRLLAGLVGNPVSFKDPDHRLLGWAGSMEELDPVRRSVIAEGSVPIDVLDSLERRGVLQRIRTADGPFRVGADAAIGLTPRVVCPVWTADSLLGYLSISEGNRTLDALDYLAVETGATVLSFQLARERAVQEREHSHRALMAYDLVFGPGGRHKSSRLMHGETLGIDLDRPHVAIAFLVDHEHVEDSQWWARKRQSMIATLEAFLQRRGLPSWLTFGMADSLAAFISPVETVRALAEGAVRELRAYHVLPSLGVGISLPRHDVGQWRTAWEEARLAGLMAQRKGIPGAVVEYGALGALRLLDVVPESVVEEQLKATLGDDPEFRARFQETFGALVSTGFNKAEAARRLYIHVNTLKYRLRRIAEVTGCDPTNPGQRFTLECVLRLLELRASVANSSE